MSWSGLEPPWLPRHEVHRLELALDSINFKGSAVRCLFFVSPCRKAPLLCTSACRTSMCRPEEEVRDVRTTMIAA